METIVVFFNIQLPEGSAAATRAVAWGQLFQAAGYSSVLLGVNYNRKSAIKGSYKGVSYELLDFPELQYKGIKRLKRNQLLKKAIHKYLVDLSKKTRIKAIILGNPEEEVKWLLSEERITGIPVIPDVVEWYDFSRFNGPMAIFKFLQNRINLRFRIAQCRNVICISSLLEDYYKKKGCNVIRIPTILDTNTFKVNMMCDVLSENIVIAYAGSPAKKDLIINMVKALTYLSDKERKKVRLNIYGADLKSFRKLGLDDLTINLIGNSFNCYGRIPHEEVKINLSQADYTVLLRPNKRYANAGFPTKVGESMALGVPVIANITSDLSMYLHDGIEGVVCKSEDPEDCANAIRRVLGISLNQKLEMKKNARIQAEKSFDYRNYIGTVKKYIEGMEKK